MADLLTLAAYKTLVGVEATDNRDDPQITALLAAASQAVRTFTDRKFEIASTPSTRVFQYDGSGFLDIDDAVDITLVATDAGVLNVSPLYELDEQEWVPMPHREETTDPPYYYLLMLGGRWLPASSEMGFERNLDTLDLSYRQPTVSVTATFGWPEVPADVQLATAYTVKAHIESGAKSDDLSAEAIAGFSRSWNRNQAGPRLAIPGSARDLLTGYVRLHV